MALNKITRFLGALGAFAAMGHWMEWVEMERFRSGKEILFPPNLVKKIL